MRRAVIHIQVNDFPIAVERVLEPRLNNRPVAVGLETAQRSLAVAVSAEARKQGVYRGMSLDQACRQCRDLIVLPTNEDLYQRATRAFWEVLQPFTPVIEPLRFGHAYLDMTGSGRLAGYGVDAAARLQREIHDQLRLEAVAGVATNKLVSKVASEVVTRRQKSGLCDVPYGNEARFLAPLYVNYLPEIGKKTRQELLDLNLRLIRDVAAIEAEQLQMVFGRRGLLLHQRANGIDPRPVQPPKRTPRVVELLTLETDCNHRGVLLAHLHAMLARAVQRLRRMQRLTGCLVIDVQYSDYKTNRIQHRFKPMDTEPELAPVLRDLFPRAVTRRVRVRKLTLTLEHLSRPPQQLSLFEPPGDPRIRSISTAVDRIRDRFGEDAIRFGYGERAA